MADPSKIIKSTGNKMKNVQSQIKLEAEGFNNLESRAKVVELLDKHLGVDFYAPVDVDGKEYWSNNDDTLVIAVDPEEVWRFGGNKSLDFAVGLANFIQQCGADEFDTITLRGKRVMRFWWD